MKQQAVFRVVCSSHQIYQSHHIFCLPSFLYRILNIFSREDKWKTLWLSSGFFCLPFFLSFKSLFLVQQKLFKSFKLFCLYYSCILRASIFYPFFSLPVQTCFRLFLFTPCLWPQLLFELPLPLSFLFMLKVVERADCSHWLKSIFSRFILGPFHTCPDPLYSVHSLPLLCPASCL